MLPASHYFPSIRQFPALFFLGIFLGFVLVMWEERHSFLKTHPREQTEKEVEEKMIVKEWPEASFEVASCLPANFGYQGKSYEEERREKALAFARAEALRRANAWPTEFVKITDNMKNPNSVKIPFAQAPGISADTREENGRRVCEHKKDKGNKSKQKGKDVHIDRECCLDPDEIPNPRCYYPKLGANNSPDRATGADGKKYIK